MRTRRGLVVLLAAAVLLLPNLAPVPARATSPGGNGPIAFERGTGLETEIWLMAPDGTGQAAIPGLAWTGFKDPALSPDSKAGCFQTERSINRERIAQLKQVDILRYDACLTACPLDRKTGRIKRQHICAVVQRQRIHHAGRAHHLHQWKRQPLRGQ